MKSTGLKTLLVAGLSAAVMVTGMAGAAHAKERRVATLAPAGSSWMNILEEGARRLEKATEGRVKTKFYPGGTQGDEKDVVRKMKSEQLDGAALTTVGLSLIYPGIRVLQLPFMFESEAEVDYVRDKMWPYFRKKFAEQGFHLEYPGDIGWTYLYAKRALAAESDLKQVKMWAWTDDPIVRAFFKRLGVNSVPLGVPEVLGALKTGRIDGAYGSPLSTVALQWYTEVTHATRQPVGYGVGAMVIRADVWEAMSAADRKAEDGIGKKTGQILVKNVRKDNERALRAMKKSGIKVVDVPGPLMTKLENEAKKVWADLAGDVYTKAELDMVMKYRNEFRAKNK